MIEALFPFVLGEVILGGGGRTFSIGPVSLRMVLFAVAVLASLVGMATAARQRDGLALAILMVFAFIVSLVPGLLVDAARGTPARVIGTELQPLLFWLSAPFFALAIQNVQTTQRGAMIIISGGLLVAIVTSFIMIGLTYGFISFGPIYFWGSDTEELFFRGRNNFFYKGHFFVGISLIFCIVLKPRFWKILASILALSLALSLTRGLYIALAIAIFLSFFSGKRHISIVIAIFLMLFVAVFYSEYIGDIVFDPSRLVSGQTRSRDVSYFLLTVDYTTILLGDGFGALLNGRIKIENSYLWAVWRFGIIGLLFMLFPLIMCVRYFGRIPEKSNVRNIASAYFFGVVMLYILTAFNPFLNNSIGITYLLCALFSLRRLSRIAVISTSLKRAVT